MINVKVDRYTVEFEANGSLGTLVSELILIVTALMSDLDEENREAVELALTSRKIWNCIYEELENGDANE